MPRVQHSRILDIPFNSIRKYTKISRWGRANFENLRLDRPKFVHEDVTIGPKGGSMAAGDVGRKRCVIAHLKRARLTVIEDESIERCIPLGTSQARNINFSLPLPPPQAGVYNA